MIDIVIVNWNAGQQIADAVRSCVEFGDGLVSRIIVVDNGSTDGSPDLPELAAAKVIRAGENLGFARACNLGARAGDARYVLFLNPDAMLMAGTLRTVVGFMDTAAAGDVGICGVRLLDEAGETARHCARFPGWRTLVGQSLGISGRVPGFPAHFMTQFDHASSRAVDEVIGAFYFVRRAVFDTLDGFDERFFVYYEELDFARRAASAGVRTWYLAEACAFHKGGGTSDRVKAHRLFYVLRSRILYAFKHLSRAQAWAATFAAVALEPIARLARALLRGSAQEARDTWRGFKMLWADLKPTLARARR